MLQTADLDFIYPEELVAQHALPRGKSRILFISRDKNLFDEISWEKFFGLFGKGDTLVLNDSRVLWARLFIPKESGAMGEIFFLKAQGKHWEVLSKGLNLKEGKSLVLPGGLRARVLRAGRTSTLEIETEVQTGEYFDKWGKVPLPPYIVNLRDAQKDFESEDRIRYQNTWAQKMGSVAAPTAGLHFNEEHLSRLQEKGVKVAFVTLHVGAGTFLPLDTENLTDFQIHSEYVEVNDETCEAILRSQAAGKKIWACGTTVLRALETATLASPKSSGRIKFISPFQGETRLFIQPGYPFLVVDKLLTNFHQPKSSLLALAAAFASRETSPDRSSSLRAVEKILKAYRWAIEKKFRLFSYGDLTVIA